MMMMMIKFKIGRIRIQKKVFMTNLINKTMNSKKKSMRMIQIREMITGIKSSKIKIMKMMLIVMMIFPIIRATARKGKVLRFN